MATVQEMGQGPVLNPPVDESLQRVMMMSVLDETIHIDFGPRKPRLCVDAVGGICYIFSVTYRT
jgi:hypothetical protein